MEGILTSPMKRLLQSVLMPVLTKVSWNLHYAYKLGHCFMPYCGRNIRGYVVVLANRVTSITGLNAVCAVAVGGYLRKRWCLMVRYGPYALSFTLTADGDSSEKKNCDPKHG